MNALFGSLTTDGLEEVTDRLGGFSPLASDIYTGTIKAAYAGASSGGAQNITLIVDAGGREYRETIYITNKKGENYWVNDNKKKVPLPGFTTINNICLCASGKPLAEQDTADKVFNVYDPEARKELPKSVPMLTDLVGQEITLAILKVLENKNEKQGDKYVPTADTRESNQIDAVFNTDTRMTVAEALSGAEEPVFHDAWLEKNKGQVRDKREIKDGDAGVKSGRPGGAPQAGAKAPGRSLFGK